MSKPLIALTCPKDRETCISSACLSHGCQMDVAEIEPKAAAVDETIATRASRYGDFKDVAQISQDFLSIARAAPGWERMDTTQREGTTLILHKLARALSGDPTYKDNWHDIGGYAKLVEDRLP